MKHYKTEHIPSRTQERLEFVTCDLCGDKTENHWTSDFSAFESDVSIRDGKSYPEGGSGTEIEYDICPACFKEKLIPWLESQGAVTKVTEWEW